MNTKITALTLAAATAFAFTPKPASAHDNVAGPIIAGAIIGGLLGVAIANADHHESVYVDSTYCPPAPVIAGGYWTTTSVNVWVAPAWIVTTDYYGRPNRRYVAGHYEYRNDRVWVAHNRSDNRGHEVARGYGNDRHDNNRDRRDDHRNDRRDDRRDHR